MPRDRDREVPVTIVSSKGRALAFFANFIFGASATGRLAPVLAIIPVPSMSWLSPLPDSDLLLDTSLCVALQAKSKVDVPIEMEVDELVEMYEVLAKEEELAEEKQNAGEVEDMPVPPSNRKELIVPVDLNIHGYPGGVMHVVFKQRCHGTEATVEYHYNTVEKPHIDQVRKDEVPAGQPFQAAVSRDCAHENKLFFMRRDVKDDNAMNNILVNVSPTSMNCQ